MSNLIRSVLSSLCKVMKFTGCDVSAETLRKSKFNQLEDTSTLWSILYRLLSMDSNLATNAAVESTVLVETLKGMGYQHLSSESSSRQLLLCLSWVIISSHRLQEVFYLCICQKLKVQRTVLILDNLFDSTGYDFAGVREKVSSNILRQLLSTSKSTSNLNAKWAEVSSIPPAVAKFWKKKVENPLESDVIDFHELSGVMENWIFWVENQSTFHEWMETVIQLEVDELHSQQIELNREFNIINRSFLQRVTKLRKVVSGEGEFSESEVNSFIERYADRLSSSTISFSQLHPFQTSHGVFSADEKSSPDFEIMKAMKLSLQKANTKKLDLVLNKIGSDVLLIEPFQKL